MSTYCSDPDLDVLDTQGTPGLVDVAGRGVRLSVDGRSVYVTADAAQDISAALDEAAQMAAHLADCPDHYDLKGACYR